MNDMIEPDYVDTPNAALINIDNSIYFIGR